jgi:O-acetyl-ADP-ribose deacetylase (regulator of RNase III)
MRDDRSKEEPNRSVKELLRDAFFETENETVQSLSPTDEDTTELTKQKLVTDFLKHLENTAEDAKGNDRRIIESSLRTLRSKINVDRSEPAQSVRRNASRRARRYWTNASVRALAGENAIDDFPVNLIAKKAEHLIWDYVENGGTIEPLDPFALAEYMKIRVEPSEDIPDAQTRASGSSFLIQYNPIRPQVRVRFSICHELIHTIFPDCRLMTRNRSTHQRMSSDEWQLESLCDVGAAGLLMPTGSFKQLTDQQLSIDSIIRLRDKLQVSTEAILLRIIELTRADCFVFSASHQKLGNRFKVDYIRASSSFKQKIPYGLHLPEESVVSHCTGINFTDHAVENWFQPLGDLEIQCVAVSPYPGQKYPRVMGIGIPTTRRVTNRPSIHYVSGDATEPRGNEHRIIAQVVNDRAPTWGGGFARVIRRKWPQVQENFHKWAQGGSNRLQLGNCHLSSVDDATDVFSMVCQHGYKPTLKPSIRYGALSACLDKLGELALSTNSSIHMPRIGCGQAGGNWHIVSEMITRFLCERGLSVTVYDPPGSKMPDDQASLFSLL